MSKILNYPTRADILNVESALQEKRFPNKFARAQMVFPCLHAMPNLHEEYHCNKW